MPPSLSKGGVDLGQEAWLSLTSQTATADTPSIGPESPAQKRRKVSVPPATSAAMVDASGRLTSKKMPEAWRGIKGKRGQLRDFVDMPVDILLEVFAHLSVRALHTLALSSKALRALLLNRSMCSTLWKDAFAGLQPAPPPCPADVTLPQYASFLFSRECFTCDKKTGLSRSFECLRVCCKECILTEFINVRGIDGVEATPFSITPRYHVKRPERPRGSWEPFRAGYERHKEILGGFKTEQEGLAYVKAEQARMEDRKRHLGKFYVWSKGMKTVDQNERRASREEAIIRRLRKIGYEDVLQKLDRNTPTWMKRNPPERSALVEGFVSVKPLTNKGLCHLSDHIETRLTEVAEWAEMKPTLVARVDALRKAQEDQDRLRLILKRTDALAAAYGCFLADHPDLESFAPPLQQLAKLEPFQTAIYDTPESGDEQAVAVFENGELYGPVIEAWKTLAEESLRKLLPWSSINPDVPEAQLDACTFECTLCHEGGISYPQALTHTCLFIKNPPHRLPEMRESDTNVSWEFNLGPWRLEYDNSVHFHSIAKAYDVDDTIFPYKELDKLDTDGFGSVLECLRCPDHWACRSWREAACHEISCHPSDGSRDLEHMDWLRHPPNQLPPLQTNELLDFFAYADYYAL